MAVFSLFFLTACENPVTKNTTEVVEELSFTDNVTVSEEDIILEFTPNRSESATYEVKYSIQETGGETANETKTMEDISEALPIIITISDLEAGAEYLTGIVIEDEEGNEVHKFQDTITQK